MRLKALILLTCAVAIVLVSWAVSADEGGIRVVEAKAESQFPDGVKFSISAESAGMIDEIRVFFRKADDAGRSAYQSIDVEPAVAVSGESLLSASGGGDYFPPGTRINYSFEIRDKAGAMVRTDDQEFVYLDNRFEWATVSEGLITVYYYGEYVEERARVILEAAHEAMELMTPVLGIEPTEPLRIVSYNNYRHMSSALPFRSQAIREGLQTQGMAFSDERVLLVHGFDPTITGTTSHEFVHLLVAEAAGGTSARVPAWLNEGLAELGNIDPTDDYDAALRYGIFTRRIKPLWYQNSFGGEPEDILIAYGQGRSVVQYMIGRYGPERMAELFRVLRRVQNIDMALMEVYELDQYGLDTAWRTALGLDPLPSPEELERLSQDGPEEASQDNAGPGTAPEEGAGEEGTGSDSGSGEEEVSEEPNVQASGEESPEETTDETPEAVPAAGTEDPEPGAVSPGGCAVPASGGPATAGIGMVGLLSAPAGLLLLPWLRRRWPFG